MCSKPSRQAGGRNVCGSSGSVESMDDYLQSLDLWRKVVPRDNTSLYRIVSEQVFSTQIYHEHVKKTCQKYLEEHHNELLDNGSSSLEMQALSFVYRRDFIVFQSVGRPPVNVTKNGFKAKICICVTNGGHYDEIFHRSYLESAAISQSILYEILYEKVFGVDRPMTASDEMINNKSAVAHNNPKANSNSSEKPVNSVTCNLTRPYSSTSDNNRDNLKTAPFPYRIAKSLSPFILRNVEYEVWADNKKGDNHEIHTTLELFFEPGDKCQVTLDGHEDQVFNAHIQELMADGETAVVFIEELVERKQVMISKLIALPKVLTYENSWKRRGKKKNCDCSRTAPSNENSNQGSRTPKAPGGFAGGRRMRINSAGHPIKANCNDSVIQLPGSQRHGNAVVNKKDVKNSRKVWATSGRQRFNSEPGDGVNDFTSVSKDVENHAMERPANDVQLYWDSGDYVLSSHSADAAGDAGMQLNGTGGNHFHCGEMVDVESSAQVNYNQMPSGASSPLIVPQVLASPQGMVATMPFYNFVIPLAVDNFSGPINTCVTPSIDPSGVDLPVHDSTTLRFFFNLGVQYYRVSSYLYHQQQQMQAGPTVTPSLGQYVPYPVVTSAASLCITSPSGGAPVVTADVMLRDDGGNYSAACLAGMSPPAINGFYSSTPTQQYVHYYPAHPMQFQQLAL